MGSITPSGKEQFNIRLSVDLVKEIKMKAIEENVRFNRYVELLLTFALEYVNNEDIEWFFDNEN